MKLLNRMKRLLIVFILCIAAVTTHAQYLSERADANVQVQLNDMETRIRMLEEQIYNDTVQIERMSQVIDEQQVIIDSLCQALQIDEKNLKKTKYNLKGDIDENHEIMLTKVDFLLRQINTKSLWAGLVGIGAIILSFVLYFIIRKKNRKNTPNN